MSDVITTRPIKITSPASGFTFSARDVNGAIRSLSDGSLVYAGEQLKINGDYHTESPIATLNGKASGNWTPAFIPAPGQDYTGASYWDLQTPGTDDSNYGVTGTKVTGSW